MTSDIVMAAKFKVVIAGLDRQSIDLRKNFRPKKMDARVKPAHDMDRNERNQL
jgi:hypothetical protein